MRVPLVLAVVLAPLLLAVPARAAQTDLERYYKAGEVLFQQLAYERALEQFQEALRAPGKTPEDVVNIDLYMGILYMDLDREADAREIFWSALLLSPDAQLPVVVSPRIQGVVEDVRAHVRKILRQGPGHPGPVRPRLLVISLDASSGAEVPLAEALTHAVTGLVADQGAFDILASTERRKPLDCGDAAACAERMANVEGARFVLRGSLERLGDSYQLGLVMEDVPRRENVGRAVRVAKDVQELRAELPYAVAEATARPSPPPPSHALSYSLIGAGGALFAAGAALGAVTLVQQNASAQELKLGERTPGVLAPLETYRRQNAALGAQNTLALSGLLAGAATVAAGIYWYPRSPTKAAAVSLVPAAGGAALVGWWR